MYQVMVENIFKEKAKEGGHRCAIERKEIHEVVQNQVSELDQDFHSQSEVRRLANWALRELRKEGRLQQAGPGRFRLARRRLPTPGVDADEPGADADEAAAEGRRLAWQQKRDRHRARTRMEERYRRRQRRVSQSSSSDVMSATPSEQSLPVEP